MQRLCCVFFFFSIGSTPQTSYCLDIKARYARSFFSCSCNTFLMSSAASTIPTFFLLTSTSIFFIFSPFCLCGSRTVAPFCLCPFARLPHPLWTVPTKFKPFYLVVITKLYWIYLVTAASQRRFARSRAYYALSFFPPKYYPDSLFQQRVWMAYSFKPSLR